jgi:hypothetical protein
MGPSNSTKQRPFADNSRLSRNRSVSSPAGGVVVPSSLDLPETSSQPHAFIDEDYASPTWVSPDYIPFEHRGWLPMRRRVQKSFERVGVAAGRQFNYAACCENCHVYTEPCTGAVEFHLERCHDRFCLPCGQIRSRKIAAALKPLIEQAPSLFITLTIRGKPTDSLASLLDQLSEGWKALRRIPYWSQHVTGGAVMSEIKWSKTSGGHWHPHYHIVANGADLDEEWLKQTWNLITRGSFQVDVQEIRESGKALSYVTKYASKPLDASFVFKEELIDEAVRTLKGRRLCACFGSWYGTKLNTDDAVVEDGTEPLTSWRYCGTTRELGERASMGDAWAKHILAEVEQARAARLVERERRRGPPTNGPPSVVASNTT